MEHSRSGGQIGVWGCELNQGDEEQQGPGLPNACEDVEANLDTVPAGLDARVANCPGRVSFNIWG